RYWSRLNGGKAATSEEAWRNWTRSFVTVWTSAMGTCRSPLPFMETTMSLISRDSGSTMTFVTSPISRSVQRTFDFNSGCMVLCLLFLDRFRRIDRRVLERDQPSGESDDVSLLHQVLILVGHLLFFVFLFKPVCHPAARIKDLLFYVIDCHIAADIVELGTALFPALASQFMTVVAFLKLPLVFTEFENISACGAGG